MKYQLSLVAGSILLNDTQKTARLYTKLQDWHAVRDQILQENELQKKTSATRVRQAREIIKRLQTLTSDQLALLLNSDPDTAKLLVLLSMAKTYRFVREFIEEIIRAKWLVFDYILLESDYERFFSAKSEYHPELEKLTQTSKAKLKQVIYRTLVEAGLLDSLEHKRIIQPFVSDCVAKAVVSDDARYLRLYLLSDSDIENVKTRLGKIEA